MKNDKAISRGKEDYMNKRTNPVSIIVAIVIVIVAAILAFVVKGMLPTSMSRWSGLVFYAIITIVGGSGVFIVAKKMNGHRR